MPDGLNNDLAETLNSQKVDTNSALSVPLREQITLTNFLALFSKITI